jgi:hypothetical protein
MSLGLNCLRNVSQRRITSAGCGSRRRVIQILVEETHKPRPKFGLADGGLGILSSLADTAMSDFDNPWKDVLEHDAWIDATQEVNDLAEFRRLTGI